MQSLEKRTSNDFHFFSYSSVVVSGFSLCVAPLYSGP